MSENAKLTDRHIDRIWERMVMIFGHRWTSSFGTADDGTWLAGLADITPEQIGTGLVRCKQEWVARQKSGDEVWPPNLLEFRALCLPAKPLASYHRMLPSLPKPEIDRDKAASEIEKMRGLVN